MMFKYLILTFLAVSCQGTVIKIPGTDQVILVDAIVSENNKPVDWTPQLLDFLSLIDVEKVVGVAVQYANDPEVINFLGFILGPEFKEIIWEFESTKEFHEAYLFLADKGYDIKDNIDLINLVLELPPYNKPISRNYRDLPPKQGMSGFIVDMVGALPLEEMKNLFETKLENDPKMAELIAILDSPEFMRILKKMAKNPKIEELKSVFESYGIDFKLICTVMQEVLGELYRGVFFCYPENRDFVNRMYLL